MQWLYIVIFLLFITGIIFIFQIKFRDIWQALNRKKKITLKDELNILANIPPKGYFAKEFYEIEQILHATGRESRFEFIKKLSLILFAVGVFLALLIDNAYMIPVFAVGFSMAPVWYIRSSSTKYSRRLSEDLESVLSIITTSYLRSEDIKAAVKENLPYMNEPIKSHFQAFVTDIEMINANIISGLNALKMKIPDAIFHEWINTLIQCQSDRNMKHTLTVTVQKYSDMRIVQSELDSMLAAPKREAITMIFLVLSNIPLLYFLNKDWFHSLIFTIQGKIALAICAAIILFAFARIIKLSKPIEYRR